MEETESNASSIVAYIMLALIAVVLVALVAALNTPQDQPFGPTTLLLVEITILLCAILWPGAGTLYGLSVMVMGALAGMGSGKALENFSSFSPAEEKAFVVHERNLHANASSASSMALIASGLLGAAMVAIVLLFGSPAHEGPNQGNKLAPGTSGEAKH